MQTFSKYWGLVSVVSLMILAAVLVRQSMKSNTYSDFFSPHLIEAKGPVQDLPPLLKEVDTISCVGDSITYSNGDGTGYPSRLSKYLAVLFPDSKFTVLNKGISGEHSHEMLARFQEDAIDTGAQLIIIFAGTNDVGHGFSNQYPDGDGPRGTSLPDYLKSMAQMIDLAQGAKRRVIVVTPPTIFEDAKNPMDMKLDEYCQALRKLAEEKAVPVADVRQAYLEIFTAYRNTCDSKDYLLTVDGVHPNSLGNKIITECVLSSLGISADSRRNVIKY